MFSALGTVFRRHDMSGLTESEIAETMIDPYEETPKYAVGIVGFVCGFMALFVLARLVLVLRRRFAPLFAKSTIYQRITAVGRYLASKQQRLLGVHFPTLGVLLVTLAFFAFTMSMNPLSLCTRPRIS